MSNLTDGAPLTTTGDGNDAGTTLGSSAVPTSVALPNTIERKPTSNGFVFLDGSVYVGDVLNNMRHGSGKMTYATGLWYDGD